MDILNIAQIFNIWQKGIPWALLHQIPPENKFQSRTEYCLHVPAHYEPPPQGRWLFFVIYGRLFYCIKFQSFPFRYSSGTSIKIKEFIDEFLKAQFIITNAFNSRSEEPLVTKRTRNEKPVQRALRVLHFHKVQYNRDSSHFNANQRGNPVGFFFLFLRKGLKNENAR